MSRSEDRSMVSQWLMDEGSVSVCYSRQYDSTQLLVCGSMNDYEVLSRISEVLRVAISSSKSPSLTTLPMGAIRVQSARAYALLEVLLPNLVGLKAKEATAALAFFPPSGKMAGRHTTDEFLFHVWKTYALKTLLEWNSRRRVKISQEEIESRGTSWLESRIARSRRFLVGGSERCLSQPPSSNA